MIGSDFSPRIRRAFLCILWVDMEKPQCACVVWGGLECSVCLCIVFVSWLTIFQTIHALPLADNRVTAISWLPPPEGVVMLNTYHGSIMGHIETAGIGGLLRTHDGIWISGFSGRVDTSSILHAEIFALYKGLGMAR